MNVALALRSGEYALVDRESGEVLDPLDPEVQLAGIEAIRQEERKLGSLKRGLTGMLLDHATTFGASTVTLPGGARYRRVGGPVKEYDAHAVERGLLAAGMPPERVAEVVVTTIDKKVNGVEARKAAAANPAYAAVIDAATVTVDRPFRIEVA